MSYVSRVINPDRLSVLEHLGAPLALVGLTDVDEQHTGDGGMGSTPRGTFCWANPACYRILNGHPLQVRWLSLLIFSEQIICARQRCCRRNPVDNYRLRPCVDVK